MSLLNGLRDKRDDLDARLDALNVEAAPLRQQLGNIDKTRSKILNERAQIDERIKALASEPSVSDHAVVRYLERKHGFCFEDIRAELLTPFVVEAMRAGVETVKAHGGTLIIKGAKIVTFAP